MTTATIARVWRGRTRRDIADEYERYLLAEGIPPLQKTALGVQLFREDREEETWFTTTSYWPNIAAMTAFTKGDPVKVHHLARDAEYLMELPERIAIQTIVIDLNHGGEHERHWLKSVHPVTQRSGSNAGLALAEDRAPSLHATAG
jgi:hypothetical protein